MIFECLAGKDNFYISNMYKKKKLYKMVQPSHAFVHFVFHDLKAGPFRFRTIFMTCLNTGLKWYSDVFRIIFLEDTNS
jgi:hypothetical protein